MIRLLERGSDWLLSMVLPSTPVTAAANYHYHFCESCSFPQNGQRRYRLTCTPGGNCYRSCTGPCWTYCQASC